MKNAVFCDTTPSSYLTGTSLFLFTQMLRTIPTGEEPALARAARHHIPEDGILDFVTVSLGLICEDYMKIH
jgi:hypothetical protein